MNNHAIGKPSILYKFRDWDNCKHKLILTHSLLWFCSPEDLNDPFDCSIPLRYDRMDNNEKKSYFMNLARGDSNNKSEEELEKEVEVILENSPFFNSNVGEKDYNRYFELTAKNYGILSFSKTSENHLLWSHYSNNHMGFCVALDSKKLDLTYQMLFKTDNHIINGFEIEYCSEYPILIPVIGKDDYYFKRFTIKSKAWSYEKEYRFIYSNNTRLARGYTNDILKTVFLGWKMPIDHKREIAEVLINRFPNSKLMQAKKQLGSFELEFEEIYPNSLII